MSSKMDEGRKWKCVNKKEYLDRICDKIKEFQRTGCYDLRYMKTKEVGWKENQGIQNIGTEDPKGI
jgi:hypothetical protein